MRIITTLFLLIFILSGCGSDQAAKQKQDAEERERTMRMFQAMQQQQAWNAEQAQRQQYMREQQAYDAGRRQSTPQYIPVPVPAQQPTQRQPVLERCLRCGGTGGSGDLGGRMRCELCNGTGIRMR